MVFPDGSDPDSEIFECSTGNGNVAPFFHQEVVLKEPYTNGLISCSLHRRDVQFGACAFFRVASPEMPMRLMAPCPAARSRLVVLYLVLACMASNTMALSGLAASSPGFSPPIAAAGKMSMPEFESVADGTASSGLETKNKLRVPKDK